MSEKSVKKTVVSQVERLFTALPVVLFLEKNTSSQSGPNENLFLTLLLTVTGELKDSAIIASKRGRGDGVDIGKIWLKI